MNALQKFESIEITSERMTEAAAILDDVSAQLSQDAAGIVIASDDDKELGMYILKDIGTITKGLESKRTELVKPLNDRVKEINAFFKRYSGPLAESDFTLRENVLGFERKKIAEQKRKEAEERAAVEEAEKAEADAAIAAKANDYTPDPAAEAVKQEAIAKADEAVQELKAVERPKTQAFDGVKATTTN